MSSTEWTGDIGGIEDLDGKVYVGKGGGRAVVCDIWVIGVGNK